MMDYLMWAKALVLCVRSFKRVTDNIDAVLEGMAMSRGKSARDTYSLMERAIDVIMRKQRIINLRVITTDMLNSLPDDKRHILTCRYVLSDTIAAIAKSGDISVRSVYRKLHAALLTCGDYLMKMGFDAGYFEKKYGKERWIFSTIRRFEAQEDAELSTAAAADGDLPRHNTWVCGGSQDQLSGDGVGGALV